MGEIFRREAAEHPEPFTGERLTGAIHGQVEIEHYHRYLFARSLVAGLDVLDVASGEGYGTALLAQAARSVIGIEHSGATTRSAALNFPRSRLHFVQGDARILPLADRSVDAVVSFETIEHFDRQSDFVREVRRVLRSPGCFIVSTPDRDIYSPAGSQPNSYHVHELSRPEFIALLSGSFRHVKIMQQRAMIGSALLADTGSPSAPLVFDRRGDTHFEACAGLPRAPYLLAVASDAEPQAVSPSLYIDRSDVDTDAMRYGALSESLRQVQADLAKLQICAAEATRVGQQAVQQADQAQQRAEQRADQARQRSDQAELIAAQTQLRLELTQRLAEQAELRADAASRDAERWTRLAEQAETRIAALRDEYTLLRGSMRTFLRGYLPLLRHHLFGRRT